MNLARLRALGFDLSKHIEFTRQFRIGCSSCQALTVNGVPTHERGCPGAVHKCAGCNALVPMLQKYCKECRT